MMENGVELGIHMNAAYFKKAVCDVCVNCRWKKCVNVSDGCEEYLKAIRENVAKDGRSRARRNTQCREKAAR